MLIGRDSFIIVVLLLLLCNALVCAEHELHENLPVFPESFTPFDHERFASPFSTPLGGANTTKLIPRIMWVAFKTRPESIDEIGDDLAEMINQARKDGWSVYCLGHNEQILFMEIYYPNTSLLWAIKNIHPNAGAAVSDIWRVAAVYAFGGLYIDDDSAIPTSLEQVVEVNDKFVMGRERGFYQDHCYHRNFHLSRASMMQKFPNTDFSLLFGGRRFMQWSFIAMPRHHILYRIMENIVEVIRLEYLGGFSMYLLATEQAYKYVVCATGPDIWTATILEMYLSNQIAPKDWRVLNKHDYLEFGAVFKLYLAKHYALRSGQHYIKKMVGHENHLLAHYAKFNLTLYEHHAVTEDRRSLYYVDGGVLRAFPDYDTYTMMGFHYQDVIVLHKSDFESIPKGDILPKIADH